MVVRVRSLLLTERGFAEIDGHVRSPNELPQGAHTFLVHHDGQYFETGRGVGKGDHTLLLAASLEVVHDEADAQLTTRFFWIQAVHSCRGRGRLGPLRVRKNPVRDVITHDRLQLGQPKPTLDA